MTQEQAQADLRLYLQTCRDSAQHDEGLRPRTGWPWQVAPWASGELAFLHQLKERGHHFDELVFTIVVADACRDQAARDASVRFLLEHRCPIDQAALSIASGLRNLATVALVHAWYGQDHDQERGAQTVEPRMAELFPCVVARSGRELVVEQGFWDFSLLANTRDAWTAVLRENDIVLHLASWLENDQTGRRKPDFYYVLLRLYLDQFEAANAAAATAAHGEKEDYFEFHVHVRGGFVRRTLVDPSLRVSPHIPELVANVRDFVKTTILPQQALRSFRADVWARRDDPAQLVLVKIGPLTE
jgi:hypothetical protein